MNAVLRSKTCNRMDNKFATTGMAGSFYFRRIKFLPVEQPFEI
jgi:hypothetical protein